MQTTEVTTPWLSLEILWDWEWGHKPHSDDATRVPEIVTVTAILDDLRSDVTFDFGGSPIVVDAVMRDARWHGDVLTPEGAPT
jgi:hypothetical protein